MNYTPLISAVMACNLAECRKLLARGVDVNEAIELGITALYMACSVPVQEGIMEALLIHGANTEVKNIQGITPFKAACNAREFAIGRVLLKYGANINCTDSQGNTPLLDAINYGSTSVFEFLCVNGANVNVMNGAGETPLTRACQEGNAFFVGALISRGANLNYVQLYEPHNSVLLVSIKAGFDSIVSTLIKHGANIMYENRDSENALFLACRLNRAAVVRILCTELVGLDIDMHQHTADGYTALMVAAKFDSIDAARTLLEFDCDLWMKSADPAQRVTAYELAQRFGHDDIAELIDSYANPPTTRLY